MVGDDDPKMMFKSEGENKHNNQRRRRRNYSIKVRKQCFFQRLKERVQLNQTWRKGWVC